MRRFLALVFLAATLAGCEDITHHPRCDEHVSAPIVDILLEGVHVECKPNFSNVDANGIPHKAWWDPARATVWVWPDTMSDRMLLKVLWHESGHVHGYSTEWGADAYAWCHMTPEQRLGLGFLLPRPVGCHPIR